MKAVKSLYTQSHTSMSCCQIWLLFALLYFLNLCSKKVIDLSSMIIELSHKGLSFFFPLSLFHITSLYPPGQLSQQSHYLTSLTAVKFFCYDFSLNDSVFLRINCLYIRGYVKYTDSGSMSHCHLLFRILHLRNLSFFHLCRYRAGGDYWMLDCYMYHSFLLRIS